MNTSTAIVPLGQDKTRADMFFDRPLIETDWDKVRADVRAGVIKSGALVEQIKLMEPLQVQDPREFTHWQLQQYLRLALLHEAGKQLEDSKHICEECGKRPADPVFIKSWYVKCLHCAEESEQLFSGGSRGNCEYLKPVYNPRTFSWGLLYYWSHSRDPFMFFLADFYKTRRDALLALQPFKHYHNWLAIKYKGLFSCYCEFSRMIGVDDAMNMKLPLKPEEFREILRSKIEEDMKQDHQVMGYYVRDAMEEHRREERD